MTKQRVALFDANDKFVLVADLTQEITEYFDSVIGVGSMLWANGFTEQQLKTLPLDTLVSMAEARKRVK